MYVVYTLKNEFDVLTKTIGGGSYLSGMSDAEAAPYLRNRAKAVFKDIVTILTAQNFDGAPMALSPLCDIGSSEFIHDREVFNSFLEPLTVNESYLEFPADSGTQQPFQLDGVSNFGAQMITQYKGYCCGAYLKFNAGIVPDNDPIPAYLYVQVSCTTVPGGGSRTPAYNVYFSLCSDTSEFTADNFIGTAGKTQGGITNGPKVSEFSFRSSLNPITLSYTEGLYGNEGIKMSLIISMSSPETSASGGHLLVMSKVETPVTNNPAIGDYISVLYNKANTVFFMSRYEPIDHWYNTAKEKIQGMLPWAVLSVKPGGTRYSSNAAGQSLNIFHTGTQLITPSTSGAKDVCLLKLTASSATLSVSGGPFYGSTISDKVKAEAINLIGINVQPVSPATVLLGKLSGVSGVYYVAGDGIPYGDIISAIAGNYFVNYIVLPAEPYTVGATDDSVNVNKLKLAIPLV
jgi:hypothetical protein